MILKLAFVFLILSVVFTNTSEVDKLKTTGVSYYIKKFQESFFEDSVNDEHDVSELGKATNGSKHSESKMEQIEYQNDSESSKNKSQHIESQGGNQTLDDQEEIKSNKNDSGIVRSGAIIQRRDQGKRKKRGKKTMKGARSSDSEIELTTEAPVSSSMEMQNWKKDWKVYWKKKKFERRNATQSQGKDVNMIAAMPWGLPCGDPEQHDMPWGTCMLSMECEAEHRIYRGDSYCGRSEFVCCGFQLSTYDMDQANDEISLESKGLSDENAGRVQDAKAEAKKKQRYIDKQKRRRKQARLKRKKKIKARIKEIVKEMESFLEDTFDNRSKVHKKKSKVLKKFVKNLKQQYKRDRIVLQDILNEEQVKMDVEMMLRLHQMMEINENFFNNQTFRDILINGTINKNQARMLVEADPTIYKYLPVKLRTHDLKQLKHNTFNIRGIGRRKMSPPIQSPYIDYTDYDVEYGYLYY